MSIRRLAYIFALAIVPTLGACSGSDVMAPDTHPGQSVGAVETEAPTSATGVEDQTVVD